MNIFSLSVFLTTFLSLYKADVSKTRKMKEPSSYDQHNFLVDRKMGTTVMKEAGGKCLLSSYVDLKVNGRLTEMGKAFNRKLSREYLIKIRRARVGYQEREKLPSETNNYCKNEGIIRTEDRNVEREKFEELAAGKVVKIENKKYTNTKDKCWVQEACTKHGQWGNRNQESSPVVCTRCCTEKTKGCCEARFQDTCLCEDITSKDFLMHCRFGNKIHQINYKDPSGTVVHQTFQFDNFNQEGNPKALKLHVHAHDNFQDMTVIMHASSDGDWHHASLKNNLMLKFGSRCHILDLPSDVDPVEIGLNFLEIESGNFVLDQEDQVISISSLQIVGSIELGSLHPDIQSHCTGFEVVRSIMLPAETNYQEMSKYQLIPKKNVETARTSCCSLEVVSTVTNACIQWTNPVSGTAISVHWVVTADEETELTCCRESSSSGCDPSYPDCCACYCPCEDIDNPDTFRECLSRPLALRKPLTENSVSNGDLGNLHTSNLLRAMTNLKAANGGSLGPIASFHGDIPGPCGNSPCCPHGFHEEFLPWHRLFMVQMDTEVRTQSTGVTPNTAAQPFTPATLPYWDWTLPMTGFPDLVRNLNIVDPMNPSTVMQNPFFNGFIPGLGQNTVRNPNPNLFNNPSPTLLEQEVLTALDSIDYLNFYTQIRTPHDRVHSWTGGSMGSVLYAAYDPIFYLHHNMVDLVWAVYQYENQGNSLIDPVGGTLNLVQEPFDNSAHNQQEITGKNNLVSTTLDYENNLCYTYDLTENPFERRAMDINSNNIVFGGMNLSQIREKVLQIGDTDHYYAGFFLQGLGTSYTIFFNICGKKIHQINDFIHSNTKHYKFTKPMNQKRCFPGGEFNVFGGKGGRPYTHNIVSKIDITNRLTFIDKNTLSIEIERVETIKGKEISKERVLQPVSILRYSRFSPNGRRELLRINFGQEGRNAPEIRIPEGTFIKLVAPGPEKHIFLRRQFYEAPNKSVFARCDIKNSKPLTSESVDPSVGTHFYFLASKECSDKNKVTISVYRASRNKVDMKG